MDSTTKSTIHLCAEDGAYLPNLTVMKGAPDDMLALVCTAIHIYMTGSDRHWKNVAYKLIRDVLYEEKNGKPRDPNSDRLLGALLFVTGIFALFGLVCFVILVVDKLAGLLP